MCSVLFFAVFHSFMGYVSAQSFVNLNFEQATITPDPASPYYPYAVYASNAIRGWTAVGFISPTDVLYDDISLGATSVTLCGTNSPYSPSSLDGRFSIDLYGGTEGPAGGASISQTGLVPHNTASIRFIAQGVPAQDYGAGPLLVSLDGQNVPIYAVSSGPNYTTYAGDVAAFAGQVEDLTFTAPQGANNYWELDDIQFSVTPVPEPGTWTVIGMGILFLLWRRTPNPLPDPG